MTIWSGIADCHGLESFISLPEKALEAELDGQNGTKTVSELINMLNMRAQANRHRHTVVFRCEVDDADAQAIKWLLDGERYKEALRKLKKCANNVEVGRGMQRSWRMIPNDSLDPYYDTGGEQ
jgi:hypothetical protein